MVGRRVGGGGDCLEELAGAVDGARTLGVRRQRGRPPAQLLPPPPRVKVRRGDVEAAGQRDAGGVAAVSGRGPLPAPRATPPPRPRGRLPRRARARTGGGVSAAQGFGRRVSGAGFRAQGFGRRVSGAGGGGFRGGRVWGGGAGPVSIAWRATTRCASSSSLHGAPAAPPRPRASSCPRVCVKQKPARFPTRTPRMRGRGAARGARRARGRGEKPSRRRRECTVGTRVEATVGRGVGARSLQDEAGSVQ